MFMKRFLNIAIILITITNVAAQDKKAVWFPDNLLIHPYMSNFLEPKMGVQFTTGANNIRLDIGNSRDFLHYTLNDGAMYSVGADFFTYTKLRGENDFHFPVEAVDYLFGLNAGYKKKTESGDYGFRFRFSHISAHLADGRYNKTDVKWMNNQLPHVYSREFIEFMPFYTYNTLRTYTGFTYIYHVVPEDVKPWVLHGGAEYAKLNVLPEGIIPFVSCDLRTVHNSTFTVNTTASAGIKFGKWQGPGLRIHFTYFKGKNIHGEFYDFNDEYSAIGLNVDL